jgi:hypothetical protein
MPKKVIISLVITRGRTDIGTGVGVEVDVRAGVRGVGLAKLPGSETEPVRLLLEEKGASAPTYIGIVVCGKLKV